MLEFMEESAYSFIWSNFYHLEP